MSKVQEAVKLLRDDNLVWSNDFNMIRVELADLLESVGSLIEYAEAFTGTVTEDYARES